jgi:hypothetical protein
MKKLLLILPFLLTATTLFAAELATVLLACNGNKEKGISIDIEKCYEYIVPDDIDVMQETLLYTAIKELGKPHKDGGISPNYDCSRYVQYVYSQMHISISRNTAKQVKEGVVVDNVSDLLPGDLIFFISNKETNYDNISHVGMYVGGERQYIIHSNAFMGRVGVDSLPAYKIVKRSHMKRYFKTGELLVRSVPETKAIADANRADMYFYGWGSEQSYEKAFKLYQSAANTGETSVHGMIGWMYEKGLGVNKSRSEAIKWYTSAAKAGDTDAQYRLGSL